MLPCCSMQHNTLVESLIQKGLEDIHILFKTGSKKAENSSLGPDKAQVLGATSNVMNTLTSLKH